MVHTLSNIYYANLEKVQNFLIKNNYNPDNFDENHQRLIMTILFYNGRGLDIVSGKYVTAPNFNQYYLMSYDELYAISEIYNMNYIYDNEKLDIIKQLLNYESNFTIDLPRKYTNKQVEDHVNWGIGSLVENEGGDELRFGGTIDHLSLLMIADILSYNTHVTDVVCYHISLDDEMIRILTEALTENVYVKILILHNCRISDEGGRMIANMLIYNTHIEECRLYGHRMTNMRPLADMLVQNTTLKRLSIGDVSTRENVMMLYRSLSHNNTLEELVVDSLNENMTLDDIREMVDILTNNFGLTSLELNELGINDDMFAIMVNYLKHNTTIKILIMGSEFDEYNYSNITDTSLRLIIDILQVNTTIEDIEIGYIEDNLQEEINRLLLPEARQERSEQLRKLRVGSYTKSAVKR